ncbi:MAG: RHS repeat-associated core domain-containing protein [Cyanobacteria bacterium P01_D01_bin.115]
MRKSCFNRQDQTAYESFPPNNNGTFLLGDVDADGDTDLLSFSTNTDELFVRLNNAIEVGVDPNAPPAAARSYTYDPIFNQLTSMTDEIGRQTLYKIDETTGNRIEMTQVVGEVDSAGNGETDDVTTLYSYTEHGQLDIETDALGRQTDYDYDAFGRLEFVTYAKDTDDETVWQYVYDVAGNQTAMIDPNGYRTEYVFDELNRVESITYAKGTDEEATEYFVDDAGNQIAVIDANGNLTETVYDEMNRAIQTTAMDPDTATVYGYDTVNKTYQVIASDPNAEGPLTSPLTQQTYDNAGRLIATTDAIGRQTQYVYDARGRLTATILPDGTEQQTQYDFDNNPVGRTDARGETTRSIYDARGRLTAQVDENGDRTNFFYDAANQMIAMVDANQVRTEYTYDELGRRTSVTTAAGTTAAITTKTEYDAVGNVIAQIDGLGQRTEMEYDDLDRLILTRDAGMPAGETSYTYDDMGNLLTLTDAVDNITTFTYDEQYRLETETNQFSQIRSHDYDAVGNRLSTTDRNGRTRTFGYDNLNRQTQENWLDAQGNEVRTTNRTYDAANQLINLRDPDSAYTFGYDELGRRIQVSNVGTAGVPTVVLDYGYDDDGNLISVSDSINGVAGGTVTYTYDEEDRVDRITQSGNGIDDKRVDFAYNAIGQFEAISRFSDVEGTMPVVTTNYTYDALNRLERLGHSNGTGEVAFYDFDYDLANRIEKITDIDGVTDYSYNARNELTGATHSDVDNPNETYDYDANGNRVESHLHDTDYVTGTNNQLTTDGVYTYSYDDEGNMTTQTEIATGNERIFVWDYLNRLSAVIDEDSADVVVQRVDYTYDVMNRRIAKSVDSDGDGALSAETMRFVYDRDKVLLEFEGNLANPSMRYLHGPQVDQVLAQEDGSDTQWLLSDHLGTIKDLVDDSGNVVNHRTFDSYGNLIEETDSNFDSRYSFTGREFDEETGLHYYRARYYDGELGQFISQDPIGFNGNDSNLYRYVRNSPIFSTDPLGLDTRSVDGSVTHQDRIVTYSRTGSSEQMEQLLVFAIGSGFGNLVAPIRVNIPLRFPPASIPSVSFNVNQDPNILPPGRVAYDTTDARVEYLDPRITRNVEADDPWGGINQVTDQNGHIIPALLGGEDDSYNIFAQTASINGGGYNSFGRVVRNKLRKLAKCGSSYVNLEVNLLHQGVSTTPSLPLRPTRYAVNGTFSDNTTVTGWFSNDPSALSRTSGSWNLTVDGVSYPR